MTKRAFLIMGVVSSGTRLMGRLLEAAGCEPDVGGHEPYDHRQTWWNHEPTSEDPMVIRRHIAIGRPAAWQEHPNIIRALEIKGYDVRSVVMIRNQFCSEQSIIDAPHVNNPVHAPSMYRFMTIDVFQNIPKDHLFEVVVYEALVQEPRLYLDLLGVRLGLEFPDDIETITDANTKHWEALGG